MVPIKHNMRMYIYKSSIVSFVIPLQWDLIKPKFLNIIEQLQNKFSTKYDDFYKYDKEIK